MKHYLLLFLFTFTYSLSAQTNPSSTGKISGSIIDSSTKTPVEYASVTVFALGNTPVNGNTSDNNGNFTIDKLPYGEYSLAINFIGYSNKVIEHIVLTAEKPTARYNAILLTASATLLQSVEITAKTQAIKNKIDKLVYNPENDLAAQGGTAIDLLKKVPMVTVDIDGNVELLGSPGINFLINGKPSSIFGSSLADALQSIPASQIKKY